MKTAIVADSHGNYYVLLESMKRAKQLGAERLFHLGDIVHKGDNYDGERSLSILNPYPDSVNQFFPANNIFAVRGNKDPFLNPEKYPKISTDNFKFLQRAGTEKYFESESLLMIHHFPENDSRIIKGKDIKTAYEKLKNTYPDLAMCFYGHTHVPAVFEDFQEKDISNTIQLKDNKIYFVNPGSLWAKEKYFRPKFAVYDDIEKTIEFHSL